MPDINCTVCGEPWDRHGLYHGDVTPGEADAILSGKGCPSCSGFHPETDADYGYDPGAIDDASIVFEQCAHCEVAITADVGDFTYQQWKDGITRALAEKTEAIGESYGTPLARNQWSRSRGYAEFIKVHGDTLCTQCAPICNHCGEPIDKRSDDYFFYEMNDYHVECYLEVEAEENLEYFIESMDEVLSKNDMAIDGETDYFQLSQAIDWDGNCDYKERTEHEIIQAFIDTHLSTLIHTDFGGPYTKKQWETLLTKIEDDDTGDLADWTHSRKGGYRVFIADDPTQSMEATEENYLKYITEYNRENVL